MTETNINLGCTKINITRDKHHYAPMDVINPRVLNPIPLDAKTYKLTPTTTLFFKKVRCAEFNFGWQKIKIQKKGKDMYEHFSEREHAAVARTSYKIKDKKKLELLHENRVERKAMNFWQKTAVFFVEAHYDTSRFFEDHRQYNYWNKWHYSKGTPGDRLTLFFLKQNKKYKKDKKPNNVRTQVVLPSAPVLPEPSYNPEYKAGTTINNININFNFTCAIL